MSTYYTSDRRRAEDHKRAQPLTQQPLAGWALPWEPGLGKPRSREALRTVETWHQRTEALPSPVPHNADDEMTI